MRLYVLVIFLAKLAMFTCSSTKVFYAKIRQSPQNNFDCIILEQNTLRKFKGFQTTDQNEVKVFFKAALTAPSDSKLVFSDESKIIEIFAKSEAALDAHIRSACMTESVVAPLKSQIEPNEDIEVVRIVDGGDPANRIDVVFMGDGYTAEERNQFFDDIHRLTDDMFRGETFRSYLPVFNVWAIYVESAESGIGYNGPRDTPFQLYRQQGQLRGVYTRNAAYARQVCLLTGPSGCDYPSLIGNDDYYGGLGGEFVISTKSNRTGTVVLRHEMGHNFVSVGEEYDDGSAYFGVNSANTISEVVDKWGHWLTIDNVRAERSIYRLLEYPWADLINQGEQTFSFTSDGLYSRWHLDLSVTAAAEPNSLEFRMDGEILPWVTKGSDDREFYDWSGDYGFTEGTHTLTVRSTTNTTHPAIQRMICSVTLHEFGNEDEFNIDNNVVSAYPTWDYRRVVRYRPTNAGCLMRNMTHDQFCPVCQEGMWYRFMERISLIDNITVSTVVNPNLTRTVTLQTLQLGQLRQPGNEVPGEALEIRWYYRGIEQPEFNDRFEINARVGTWRVSVKFLTSEVRYDPNNLLLDTESFVVPLGAE